MSEYETVARERERESEGWKSERTEERERGRERGRESIRGRVLLSLL